MITKAVGIPDIQSIRKQFPVLDQEIYGNPLVYLDNGATTQKPLRVIKAVEDYYKHTNSNVHRGVHHLSQVATEQFENARNTIQAFIGAQHAYEVLFTKGTTDSINLVASSFGKTFLNEGDEVIISTMEHHSNIVPWQMICEELGAKLKVIPINDAGELIWEEFEALITDRTKIISIVHVSNSLGTINPVKKIIDKAHERDIPVLVDAAQSIQHLPLNVQELNCDFLAFSGHKMYAPMGIGILYGKEKWLNQMVPYQGGGDMIKTVTFEKTTYNELPHKFEAGTPNVAGAIGIAEAATFITELGLENIAAYEHELLEYGTDILTSIEGIRIIGTAAQKSGVLSFLLDGAHPYDVGMILDKQGVAIRTGHHCTEPLMDRFQIPGTARASVAVYNTREELDKLGRALEKAKSMLVG